MTYLVKDRRTESEVAKLRQRCHFDLVITEVKVAASQFEYNID